MALAARLTDKQKKRIIADYVELGSYNAVAKKHHVSDTTVKRVVSADSETKRKAEHKKAENTADILAHMERQKDKVCGVLDKYLDAMQDNEKIGRANLRSSPPPWGSSSTNTRRPPRTGRSLKKLDELLGQIGGVV